MLQTLEPLSDAELAALLDKPPRAITEHELKRIWVTNGLDLCAFDLVQAPLAAAKESRERALSSTPDFSDLSDAEWNAVAAVFEYKPQDRHFLNQTLRCAAAGFSWAKAKLANAQASETVRKRINRLANLPRGNVWDTILALASETMEPRRVLAFDLIAKRGRAERTAADLRRSGKQAKMGR